MRLSNPSTSSDYGLIKYTPFGDLIWSASYNSPGNLNDQPTEFAVTKAGDVYITGTVNVNFETRINTVKFDSSGSLQWARVFNGGGSGDVPRDIKIDNQGNTIVAGNTNTPGDTLRVLIIKYNSLGDTLWVKRFTQLPDESSTSEIVLDMLNNIYLVGSYGYFINLPDFLTIKYATNGSLQWYSTYNTPDNRQDHGHQIAIDSIGNIYVAGTTQVPAGAGTNDILLKMNSTGSIQWTKLFRGVMNNNGNGGYIISGLAVSSDNSSVYYSTFCPSSINGNEDIVTLKYNNNGDSLWAKRYFGGANQNINFPNTLQLDKNNNIYIAGVGNHIITGNDYIIIKYLPDGTQKWLCLYNGSLTNSEDLCGGLAIDNNNIFITGQSTYNNNPIQWETATVKYTEPMAIVNNNNEMPSEYKMQQNYPNPFNTNSIIEYSLPKTSKITISLYNSLGELIKHLINKEQSAGYYSINVNLNDYSSGLYFYRLTADDKIIETKKLVLIK